MALPVNGSKRLISALLLIYRPRKDERLSWPSWLTCSGLFTHISGHPWDRESSPARDRRSTTVPRHQPSDACTMSYTGTIAPPPASPSPLTPLHNRPYIERQKNARVRPPACVTDTQTHSHWPSFQSLHARVTARTHARSRRSGLLSPLDRCHPFPGTTDHACAAGKPVRLISLLKIHIYLQFTKVCDRSSSTPVITPRCSSTDSCCHLPSNFGSRRIIPYTPQRGPEMLPPPKKNVPFHGAIRAIAEYIVAWAYSPDSTPQTTSRLVHPFWHSSWL